MRVIETAAKRYKKCYDDFPNIAILAKSATRGEFQLTFAHVTVGNKSFGESVMAFDLAGNQDPPSAVSINIDIAFVIEGNKQLILVMSGIIYGFP